MSLYNLTLVEACTTYTCQMIAINDLTGKWLVTGFTILFYIIFFIGSIYSTRNDKGMPDLGAAFIMPSLITVFLCLFLISFKMIEWYYVMIYIILGIIGIIIKQPKDYGS